MKKQRGLTRAAKARLVRYADDFVILARYIGPRITGWVEEKLETDLGLSLNRDKTSIVQMGKKGVTLDFLGFTLRYDRDLKGRDKQYLNILPSKKAVARLRDKIREKTWSGYKKSLPRGHRRDQRDPSRMGQLFSVRISPEGVSRHEPFCSMSVREISSEPEPTAESALSAGRESVCGIETLWTFYL